MTESDHPAQSSVPAARSQKRQVLAGAAIMLVTAVVAVLVFVAPRLTTMLKPSIEVVALMDDAATLSRESPVWIAGRELGVVVAVTVRGPEADSAERVAVRMRIPRKHAAQIRRDSELRVTSSRLVGSAVIDISPGSPGSPPIAHDDSLRSEPRGSLRVLTERIAVLNANFQLFFDDLESFKPPAARAERNLRDIEERLASSASGLRALVAALETTPARQFGQPGWQRSLDQLRQTSTQLSDALRAASERARAAQHDAQPSLESLAARADTISAILAAVQRTVAETGGGFLIRARTDSAIIKGMHRARTELDSLIAETKRNPLRFWF